MSHPADPTALEDAIRRLRELHDAAVDADRPRAAVYVGLAAADLIALLPEDDRRRGELAADALSRLDGLDGDSPQTAALAERLRGYLPTQPETIQLGGGDLNWDVDWAALQGPAQSAKSVLDMLPFMASMLPPQAPLRQALTSITDVLQAYERGEWTPQRDRSLKTAIEQVEAGGLGAGLAMTLRLIAMTIRVQRCQLVAEAGGRPQWPSLAELDALIAGFEAADDLSESLGGPFQAVDGLHHMYIAVAISIRLLVDSKRTDVRRDAAWRDRILQLLDQADEHLRQMPPAYAGIAADLRGKLGGLATALRTGTPAPGPRAGRNTVPPPPPPASPRPAPQTPPAPPPPPVAAEQDPAPPPVPDLVSLAEPAAATGPWDNLAAMGQYSGRAFDGLQILAGLIDDPVAKGLSGMVSALGATNSRRWTPEHGQQLAEMERQAADLAENEPAGRRFMLAAMVAVMRATRYQQQSASLRSADHPPASELAAVIAKIESALETGRAATVSGPNPMVTELSAILRAQAAMLLVDLSALDPAHRPELLARARAYFDQMPAEVMDRLPMLRNMAVLEQLIEGRIEPDDDAIKSVIDANPDAWDRSGSDLKPALATADRAQRSQRPEDIAAALLELQAVWIRLSAGNPMRARVLVPIATQRALLANRTRGEQTAVDAAGPTIAALRAAGPPAERDAAAQLTANILIQMLSRGQFGGPFREMEEAARGALAGLGADDWAPRLSLLTAVGAAMTMRAHALSDETLRAAARRVIAEAVQLLPEPEPTSSWFAAARLLFAWTGVHGVSLHDPESSATALRLADSLDAVLASRPAAAGPPPAAEDADSAAVAAADGIRQLREQLTAAQGQEAVIRPAPSSAEAEEARQAAQRALERAAAQKDPQALRAVIADLHQALADVTDDAWLRQRIHRTVGICHTELYWADPAERTEQTLQEAVSHLNHALTATAHATPTVEWADMLQYLARCQREIPRAQDDASGPGPAERTMRAALRELARCVMTAETTDEALTVAAAANEIVARTISWCVADGRHRAAIDIAEAGRGLVLASVVLSGRVEEVLRGSGNPAAADAWRSGDEAARATALNALWATPAGERLLNSPIGPEISVAMIGMRFDAIVYLVPPAAPDPGRDAAAETGGHAIILRPVLGEVEVVPLPGLSGADGDTPLGAYLAALDGALTVSNPLERGVDGFRGGPRGQAWADALEELGSWTYQRIIGPLLEHVRTWSLNHQPHLVLVPLGELGAIPYAAAWTGGGSAGAERGGRRYALDDLVLSYTASARLLAEVARRPPQPLNERVVLVTSPRGEHPMTRRATRLLATRQYPEAEVYGIKSERNGPATVSALLGALPGRDRPGASLLQLSTHGTAQPTPALQAKDGWLPLSRILEQARDRAPDAPGGLVITNACLTDRTQGHYDESLTLATGFLAAGATAVIGTRWPVDDDTAAALSLRLHLHLQTGHPPAEALRRAQLDLIRPTADVRESLGPQLAALTDDRLSHPASWAGHVHHGTWPSRPDKKEG
jgi:CHAT domain-containing protein